MATPVGFEGANKLYSGEAADVHDLEVFADDNQIISCWRLSPEELVEVAKTGVVWVSVWGRTLYPIKADGIAPLTIEGRSPKAEPIIPKRKPK